MIKSTTDLDSTLYKDCFTYLPEHWVNVLFDEYTEPTRRDGVRYQLYVSVLDNDANREKLNRDIITKYDGYVISCQVTFISVLIIATMITRLWLFNVGFTEVIFMGLVLVSTWSIAHYRHLLLQTRQDYAMCIVRELVGKIKHNK